MTRRGLVSIALIACFTAVVAPESAAQPLGTFRWQFLPYCNVVTVSITAQGQIFSLNGFDDQCGAGQRASATGTAFQNSDGTIGIGLSIVVAPGGGHLHVDAGISLASLGGPWNDSGGNSGSFVFTPAGNLGGSPRPAPSRPSTRLFPASEITWNLTTFAGITNVREAVLNVPEITQAIVDRGSVQVLFTAPSIIEPWTAMPYTEFRGAIAYEILYSFSPGQVMVRLYGSDNADPGSLPLGFRVVVTP